MPQVVPVSSVLPVTRLSPIWRRISCLISPRASFAVRTAEAPSRRTVLPCRRKIRVCCWQSLTNSFNLCTICCDKWRTSSWRRRFWNRNRLISIRFEALPSRPTDLPRNSGPERRLGPVGSRLRRPAWT
uniref:(northern house mosquito) hypothetical protein n=1 Tax=Culex pipiens TaxID=7175 RepID=A0A8D8CIN3_CULPI